MVLNKGWVSEVDGYFKECISRQLFDDEMPTEAIDSLFQTSVDVLSQCPNPTNPTPDNKTGILIGRVQSGKTSTFLSLVALAFDNGYDISVILGGNTKNLLEQNFERVVGSFSEAQDDENIAILSSVTSSKLLNPVSIRKLLLMGKKVVIVGLKHATYIRNISEVFRDPEIGNIPTLIIDDEGDQATLNTLAYKRRERTNERSTTYQSVITLRSLIRRHGFISVTATPQANILIDTIDLLHPDFGKLVYPGEGYCGLEEFHGAENAKRQVKLIPYDDADSLLEYYAIPDSLYQALAAFFVGGAVRLYRDGGKKFKHSMLIHPAVMKKIQGEILRRVDDLLENEWKERVYAYVDGDEDSYAPLRRWLEEAYEMYKADGVDMPEFSVLEPLIHEAISTSHTHLCNSDLNTSNDADNFTFNIFIGGNMLGRGITLPKLAVSYITRRAKILTTADSMEQRARWFGYRRDYLDVCRVYATGNIICDFAVILEHEEDIWDTIERAEKNGVPFKELPRVFKLPTRYLDPTRKGIALFQHPYFSAWTVQNYVTQEVEIANQNTDLLSAYRKKHEPKEYKFTDVQKHLLLEGCNFYEVYNELLSKFVFPPDSFLNGELLHGLNEILTKTEKELGEPIIDILWMRYERGEERELGELGRLNQLFQGYNVNPNDSTKDYPGDRELPRDDKFQLQIHYVRPSNYTQSKYLSSKIGVPVLALYMPISYIEALSGVFIAGT